MRIQLPEGDQYVDVKEAENLNGGDRRAFLSGARVTVDPETKTLSYSGDYQDAQRNNLLARIITGWNLPMPPPNGNAAILDKLSLKQLNALYKGIEAHVAELAEQSNPADEDSDPTAG